MAGVGGDGCAAGSGATGSGLLRCAKKKIPPPSATTPTSIHSPDFDPPVCCAPERESTGRSDVRGSGRRDVGGPDDGDFALAGALSVFALAGTESAFAGGAESTFAAGRPESPASIGVGATTRPGSGSGEATTGAAPACPISSSEPPASRSASRSSSAACRMTV